MNATLNRETAAAESPAASGSLPDSPQQILQYFPAQEIAEALGVSKKTIHRRADALRWPKEQVGCGFHYCVSTDLAARIAAARAEAQNEECATRSTTMDPLAVTFADIAGNERQAAKVGLRLAAVELCGSFRDLGREAALALTVQRMRDEHPALNICVRSLRDWCQLYAAHGLNGLVEQKRGVVGRHGVEVPEEFQNLGKAAVVEFGSVAMAARELATHPALPAGMRLFLHGGHARKSYVTPSIKKAITPAQLTMDLIQSPRQARLNGRWTPGDYSQCQAGDFFVSDDMTCNVICWAEWPNQLGWRIGQAQLLPVLDVRSLRWLNFRLIIRDGGQYNAQDDIWGLFGDVFDEFGLPHEGFVLEGGHWQAGCVTGIRSGLDADIRVGGLESLGLRNVRSYDPRNKIIETEFNQLQYQMDRMPGFVGREQRTDLSDFVKKRLALLRVKNPLHHPKEFFPHISQLAENVKTAMENLNHTRQDGKLLRGLSPLELWAEHNPQLRQVPESARWLYRSAMNVSQVTSNGIRVTVGSGPKMLAYYWDNPEKLVPLQGRKVVIHWNDNNPDSDAVVRLPMPGSAPKFVCIARRVQPLQRFTATPEQLESEAQRKKAAMHYARTEARSIQPNLVRRTSPIPIDSAAEDLSQRINAALTASPSASEGQARAGEAVDLSTRPQPRGHVGGYKQIRGTWHATRQAIAHFGQRQFTLREVYPLVPEPLRRRVATALSRMTIDGELIKVQRADNCKVWQVTPLFRSAGLLNPDIISPLPPVAALAARAANPLSAAPASAPSVPSIARNLVDNGDGSKTYILDAQPASGGPAKVSVGRYWGLWGRVHSLRPEIDRHALTERALGTHPKPQDMTPVQLGKMTDAFLAILREAKTASMAGAV